MRSGVKSEEDKERTKRPTKQGSRERKKGEREREKKTVTERSAEE
jgi:hypothetical protein